MKKALITGITGQDGSYLAEFLLEKGYEVHGIVRRSSVHTTNRIDHLLREGKVALHDGDLTDSGSIVRIMGEVRPDEVYNLAAQSHVGVSFSAAEYTGEADALGCLRVLEAVHMLGMDKECKIYQASTSELYGKVENLYIYLRDRIDFDHMDDYICEKVLLLDKNAHKGLSNIVAECAARTYNTLIHQGLEPGTEAAFRGFIAALHQMYLMGAAIQLNAMGYHMTRL